MKLNVHEVLGLLLIAVAGILALVGWGLGNSLWILALVLLIIGCHLFYTERIQKRPQDLTEDRHAASASGKASNLPAPSTEVASAE